MDRAVDKNSYAARQSAGRYAVRHSEQWPEQPAACLVREFLTTGDALCGGLIVAALRRTPPAGVHRLVMLLSDEVQRIASDPSPETRHRIDLLRRHLFQKWAETPRPGLPRELIEAEKIMTDGGHVPHRRWSALALKVLRDGARASGLFHVSADLAVGAALSSQRELKPLAAGLQEDESQVHAAGSRRYSLIRRLRELIWAAELTDHHGRDAGSRTNQLRGGRET